ncbi:MAG: arginine repressor [Bacillota bacterium]|nr:arginine repressor [Bacillota bacterium]
MKNSRHAKILTIINETPIETQEELVEALEKCGYHVTQATVSRDIKELKLVKIQDGALYKYAYVNQNNNDFMLNKYKNILRESIISIDYAGNLVVVKCHAGMGQAAGAALDSMQLGDIVGSIAGDDTVIVVMRETADIPAYVEKIRKLL